MRTPSPSTIRVLRALILEPELYRYGYELMELTGLKSGTLYPILIRFEERGLLEAEWQMPENGRRLPRHLYKLTLEGLAYARRHAPAAKSVWRGSAEGTTA